MNDTLVTTDTILDWLTKQVQERQPIGPELWLSAAVKLNVLLGEEHAKLYDLQQKVAQEKSNLLALGKSSAAAKTIVESLEVNKQANLQKAKIGRIEEAIRLSKVMARMAGEEMRGGQ